jgi:hypothetical protein
MRELFSFDLDDRDPFPMTPPKPEAACEDGRRPPASPLNDLLNRKAEPGTILHDLSQASQISLVARYMALHPIARDAFEERAAILEHDAGLSRQDAEAEAFRLVMQAFRDAE